MSTKQLRYALLTLVIPALVALSACSSSETKEEGDLSPSEDLSSADLNANTDKVPEGETPVTPSVDASLSTTDSSTSASLTPPTTTGEPGLSTAENPAPTLAEASTTPSLTDPLATPEKKSQKKKKHTKRSTAADTPGSQNTFAQGSVQQDAPPVAPPPAPVAEAAPIQQMAPPPAPVQPAPAAVQPINPGMNVASNNGQPTNDSTAMAFEANEPLWKNKWVLGSALLAVIVAAYLFQARSRERF